MNAYIKQRVFSWGQKLDIYDEAGNVIYYCQGEIFTIGRKLHVYNSLGEELIYIKQKVLSFMPRYEIYIRGVYAASLIKKFTVFTHDFRFENLDWRIDGDFWAHNYCVKDPNEETMMTISKQWLTWGDTYCVNINDRVDPLICIAASLVIDCACHEGNDC